LGADAVAELAGQYVRHAERSRQAEAEQVRLEDLCCQLNSHLTAVNADLRAKADWAMSLQQGAEWSAAEIARLQGEEARLRAELESAVAAGRAMESELREWAAGLERQVNRATAENERLQGEFAERTTWALQLRDELEGRTEEVRQLSIERESLERRLSAWAVSRWFHLGRALGMGPKDSTGA
jgi:predicted RNase H-like nuclease (RuvC/YqgF family)